MGYKPGNRMRPALRAGQRTVSWNTQCLSVLSLPLLIFVMFGSYLVLDAHGQTITTPPAGSKGLELDVQQLQRDRLGLENRKLLLEIKALEHEQWWSIPQPLALGATAVATGFMSVIGTLWVARRTRWGTFDLAVLQKRLEWYPKVTSATEFLALYFPKSAVDRSKCEWAGRELRACYFGGAGILLSTAARDRYFMLVEALTRAADSGRLDVPSPDHYADMMSVSKLDDYRKQLRVIEPTMKCVKSWKFGTGVQQPGQTTDNPAESFRDFVFLQTLASCLRTELSYDINGRRRPHETPFLD